VRGWLDEIEDEKKWRFNEVRESIGQNTDKPEGHNWRNRMISQNKTRFKTCFL
jgi:hypothetical protein